jgi:hypothetical protein
MANNSRDGGEFIQGQADLIRPASQSKTGDRSPLAKTDLFRGLAVGEF